MFAPPQDELREEALPEGLQDRTRITDARSVAVVIRSEPVSAWRVV